MLHWGCVREGLVSPREDMAGTCLKKALGPLELEWLGTTTRVLGTEPESSLQVYQMPLTFEPSLQPLSVSLECFPFL